MLVSSTRLHSTCRFINTHTHSSRIVLARTFFSATKSAKNPVRNQKQQWDQLKKSFDASRKLAGDEDQKSVKDEVVVKDSANSGEGVKGRDEVLLLPGKVNNLLGFYVKHKLKLLVGGTALGIFGSFGVKNVFAFTFKVVGGLLGCAVLWQWRKYTLGLYNDIAKTLNNNRRKLENVIGCFEIPGKSEIEVARDKTKWPGKEWNYVTYTFRLGGSEGHAFGFVEAIEIPKHGKTFKRELTIVKFILQAHSARGDGAQVPIVLIHKPWKPTVFEVGAEEIN